MKTKNLLIGISIVIGFSFTTVAQVVPSYVPTNGLVGWWPFNGNATDESGNGNNGTVNGATLTTDRNGTANSSYYFNVSNWSFGSGGDYIYIPYNPSFNFTDFTISTWVKRASAGSTISPQPLSIIRRFQYGYNNPSGESWILEIAHGTSSNGSILYGTVIEQSPSPAPNFYSQSSQIIPLNQWCHVIMTFSQNTNTIKLFINNQLVGTATDPSININTIGNSGISIGLSDQANGHWGPFDGCIDDIGIWNRALTQAEIATLYNGTNPSTCLPSYVPTNGLVGFWPFCGNANDESGNANNGNVNGATLTTDRNGNNNSAYYFSSSGCATRIDAQVNTTSIQTGLTMSIWAMKVGNGCVGPRLLEFWPGSSGPGNAQWGWDNSNATGFGSITSTGAVIASSFTPVSNNTWTHLVYTNDGVFGKFYQDGSLIKTITSTGNPILAGNAAFGRMNHPSNDAFNGKLDDIGIWNRALTQCEVQQLYTGVVGSAPSLTTTASSFSICSGQSTTLTASGAGTYTWVPGNLTTATVNVSPNTNTTYTVTGSNGSCTSTKTITINVNATPTVSAISNPSLLCGSTNATLTATGATSYTWMPGNVINNSITTSSLTTYTVTGKTGNCSSSKTITVQGTNILLQPQSQTVNTGTNVVMVAKSSNSLATYQWQTDIGFGFQNISNAGQYSGVTTATLTINNLSLMNNNSLYRCIISAPSCTLTSNTATLTVTDANFINEYYLLQNITIYPNPASSEITINSSVKFKAIKILNAIGEMALTQESSSNVSISTLSKGIYFIELYDEKGKLLKIGKFIKE